MAGRSPSPTGPASTGPVVVRRVGGTPTLPPMAGSRGSGSSSGGAASGAAASGRLKPSVRQTIESLASTGSQSDYLKPEQTIILFDWDDTLCPSNWIRENRPALSFFRPAPTDEKYQAPLRELSKHVDATLKLALKMGKVIIVTNAMEPWVETSCRNFLPQLLPVVTQIPVIYARSIFDSYNLSTQAAQKGSSPTNRMFGNQTAGSAPSRAPLPGLFSNSGVNKLANYNQRLAMQSQQVDELAPQKWKEMAFEQEITGFYSRYAHQSWKNVISIGDSIFERDAVRRVVLNRPQQKKKCRTKTAKLLDEPEMHELIAQVRVIHDALGLMVQYDGNLDIEIDEEDLKLDLSLAEKIMDR